ncbi:hypothetical protein [Maribacter sp. ACAM166]|uniref:hypothetical protein n=1 Tax=Maribacter sp. ACAM166 TaxID=2508996 RepID=UPI0010FD5B68|nr:hypothetical protein [Maribacter sp. ACAM166]TLP74287.1 hypothetical protein ES765_16475 [Maribacter sp. ACAM166]
MKKLITFIMLLLIVVACKKDNKNRGKTVENVSTNETYLTAIVDGVDFSVNSKKVLFIAFSGQLSRKSGIVGTNADGYEISFMLPNPVTEGSIDTSTKEPKIILSYSESANKASWTVGNDNNPTSMPFTFTILKNGKNFVEGTFSFTALNIKDNTRKQITNGKFKAEKL